MKLPYNNIHPPPVPSQGQHDVSSRHPVVYGPASPVAVYDYWQQAGPSRSWSSDSASSSSEYSASFDKNGGSPVSVRPQASGVGIYDGEASSVARAGIVDWDGTAMFGEYIKQTQPNNDPPRKIYSPAPRNLPAWSPKQCVALDAEMVGVGMYGEASSVARVAIVDWDGTVMFDEYIKQTQQVTDYRTFVSGITSVQLSCATLSLRDARKRILKILYGRLLIGHALKNDLKALGMSHPWWLIRDVSLSFSISSRRITNEQTSHIPLYFIDGKI
jgi:hypothetical protein